MTQFAGNFSHRLREAGCGEEIRWRVAILREVAPLGNLVKLFRLTVQDLGQ